MIIPVKFHVLSPLKYMYVFAVTAIIFLYFFILGDRMDCYQPVIKGIVVYMLNYLISYWNIV